MDDLLKGATVAAIIAALYLAVKHGRSAQVKSHAVPQLLPPQRVLAGLPMESENCAIPIATDYLPAPSTNPAPSHYAAPVSRLTVRTPRVICTGVKPTYITADPFCYGNSAQATTSPVSIGNPPAPQPTPSVVDLTNYCTCSGPFHDKGAGGCGCVPCYLSEGCVPDPGCLF